MIRLKHKLFLFSAFVILLSVSFVKAEINADNNPLTKYLQGLDTFSAGFEQILYNVFGEEMEKSIGVVYLKQPGKFHWAYWEPFSQFLISNGVTLWVYDEDLQQVIISNISQSIEDTPASILSGDVDINEHYVFIDGGETDGIKWMELTPRDIQSQYRAINLGFRGDELVSMLLFDNLENKTQINFLDSKRKCNAELYLFDFVPPEGVDVIDGRE